MLVQQNPIAHGVGDIESLVHLLVGGIVVSLTFEHRNDGGCACTFHNQGGAAYLGQILAIYALGLRLPKVHELSLQTLICTSC